MSETNFNSILYMNGYEFTAYNEFADFLCDNFNFATRLAQDDTLYNLIKEVDEPLYNDIFEITKEYKRAENVVTYLIYRLSLMTRYVTASRQYKTPYEIALQMKRVYPEIDDEVRILFQDNVLSTIYIKEYEFTREPKYKRNHDFMRNVEDNAEYILSYYYFLILHLPQNEEIKFILNNIQMNNLEEACSYMYTNQKNINLVIDDIKNNDFVLALIASKTNINSTITAYNSNSYLDILALLHEISQYDFRHFINRKMSVWIIFNYQNYTYISKKAKKLLQQYSYVVYKENMSFMELFSLAKYADELYKSFLSLYKESKIIKRKSSIISNDDEFHLGYIFNNDYVCARYITDNDLIDNNTYNNEYLLSEAKAIALEELNHYSSNINIVNDKMVNYLNLFDKKRYLTIGFRFIYLTILLISLIPLFFITFNNDFDYYITNVLAFPSMGLLLLNIILIFKEVYTLFDINNKNKVFKMLNKKINKSKVVITNKKFFRKKIKVLDSETDTYIKVNSNELVKKKVKLNYFKKCDKFIKKMKLKDKLNSKDYNLLHKIVLIIAFYPSLCLINYLFFKIIGQPLSYPFMSIPIFYIVFSLANISVMFTKKYNLVSAFLFVLSVVITILINY